MDITYVPMAKSFVKLAVVLDCFSRRVLWWKPSITMEAHFCVERVEDAQAKNSKLEIFDTDKGSPFAGVVAKPDIRISMGGKGAWRDNVFVERLWHGVKYEQVHLHACQSVRAARQRIGRYLDLYNRRRPHSALDGRTPVDAYFANESIPPIRLAA